MFVDGSSGSGWWYEGAGIYRHVYLVATDMLHIEQNGLGSYSNVTGAIASRDAPSQGHTADASVTVRLTVLNQGASTAKGTARATLRDADGTGRGGVKRQGHQRPWGWLLCAWRWRPPTPDSTRSTLAGKTVASGHAAEMTLPANHGTDISFSIKVRGMIVLGTRALGMSLGRALENCSVDAGFGIALSTRCSPRRKTLVNQHGASIAHRIPNQVSNAELWSIPRPYLYELTTEVVDANNMVLDNFTTSIGIHKDRCAMQGHACAR